MHNLNGSACLDLTSVISCCSERIVNEFLTKPLLMAFSLTSAAIRPLDSLGSPCYAGPR